MVTALSPDGRREAITLMPSAEVDVLVVGGGVVGAGSALDAVTRGLTTVIVEETRPPRNPAPMRTTPTTTEIVDSKPFEASPSTALPGSARNFSRSTKPRMPNRHNPAPSTAAPIRCTRSSRPPGGDCNIHHILLRSFAFHSALWSSGPGKRWTP